MTLFLPDVIGAAGKWKAAGAHAKRAVRKGKQEDGEGANVFGLFGGVAPMIPNHLLTYTVDALFG